jgi:hypothetical protein
VDINDDVLDDSSTSDNQLVLTAAIQGFLRESAQWGKFLAILGFVFIGLGVIGMLFNIGAMASGGFGGTEGGLFALAYLVFVGITIIPIIYLYNFSQKMQAALQQKSQPLLQDAFENHKSMFKFYGILVLVMIIVYIIVLVGFAAFAVNL